MPPLTEEKEPIIRWDGVIAACEILSGLAGLILTLAGHRFGLAELAALPLFLLSILAGRRLWRERRAGYGLSILAQFLQVPRLTMKGCAVGFTAGPYFDAALGLHSRAIAVHAGLACRLMLDRSPGGSVPAIGLNILALLALIYLAVESRRRAYIARVLSSSHQDPRTVAELYISRFRHGPPGPHPPARG